MADGGRGFFMDEEGPLAAAADLDTGGLGFSWANLVKGNGANLFFVCYLVAQFELWNLCQDQVMEQNVLKFFLLVLKVFKVKVLDQQQSKSGLLNGLNLPSRVRKLIEF